MRVALIGGGPTAASLMESLNRSRDLIGADVPLEVTAFDPSPHRWCGESFAPDRPEAETNNYTVEMSLREWEAQHVNAWLRANGHAELAGYEYAPRSVIGRYFQDSAEQAAARLSAFAYVGEQVTNVRVDERVRVDTSGRSWEFDYAVLCVGHEGTLDPFGLEGAERYCTTPYPLKDSLSGVDPGDDIAIIGCGLTAIDLVMALKADEHRGRITLMSRHGLLPSVRYPPLERTVQHFTVKRIEEIVANTGTLSLKDLLKLTYEELDDAGASRQALVDEVLPERYGIDRLRHQLDRIDSGEIAHPLGIKMASEAYQDAWYFLDPADKALVTSFRYLYNSLCCPMARHRATDMLELADSGQLDVVRGVEQLSVDASGQFVASTASTRPLYFDRVFCAVSKANAVHPLAASIVHGLRQAGQAQPHPFGGLNVERKTSRLLDADGRAQPRLYAIGAMTGGAFFALSGLLLLRRRAVDVAEAMFSHHQASRDRCSGTSCDRIDSGAAPGP